jgi:hypothetical protein
VKAAGTGGGGDREREETGRKRASEVFPVSGLWGVRPRRKNQRKIGVEGTMK